MPEANVLYSVTAAVVLGLVTWVAVVLKTAKEPWARELPKPARVVADDVPLETPAENEMTSEGGPVPSGAASPKSGPPSSSLPNVVAGSATAGADTTAEATAVVVGKKGEAKADAEADADAKVDADAKADADARAEEKA